MMADKDLDIFMPLLRANGALVLEGVAGIGKTHSIDKVRERFSNHFDLVALKDLLDKVIAANTGTPNGNDLIEALKDAQRNLPEDQRANVCRRIDAEVTILVMHPSTSYEEMIGGLRPAASTGGGTTFKWQPGKLTRSIGNACKDLLPGGACRNHLIVLDEINRSNLPSVLGELIYLIEPSRRVTAEILDETKRFPDRTSEFRERYCIPLGPDGRNGDLFIPSNLFFLGTMNSSDRSILGFDQALRRRFPPYRLEPNNQSDLTEMLKNTKDVNALPGELTTAIEAWTALNVFLRFVIGPDAMIGHSYWFNALENGGNAAACDRAWRFGVLPQAIHAAESARQEGFLAKLFDAAKAATAAQAAGKPIDHDKVVKEFIDNHIQSREDPKSAWGEAVKACGHGEELDKASYLLPPIGKMACVVRIVGSGHGEKLVISDV